MAWPDLVNSNTVNLHLTSINAINGTLVNLLITGCSRAINRYCRRIFTQQTFDELYNGRGERELLMRNFPLLSVQSVRYRPVTVLKITNNQAANVQARVSVTNTGISLTRVSAGVSSTDTTTVFATYVQLSDATSHINGLGNGWSAQVVGDATNYGSWPSADLYCPNGISGANDPGVQGQGALQCVAGSFAELKMHTYELQGWQPSGRQGGLVRAIPYTDPELLHPEDLIWPVGVNNFRIQYTAGFASIPEDVQEACAQWVAVIYNLAARDPSLLHQVPASGTTQGWGAVATGARFLYPPQGVRLLLQPYRAYPITMPGG